jgi:hypothetical protein
MSRDLHDSPSAMSREPLGSASSSDDSPSAMSREPLGSASSSDPSRAHRPPASPS